MRHFVCYDLADPQRLTQVEGYLRGLNAEQVMSNGWAVDTDDAQRRARELSNLYGPNMTVSDRFGIFEMTGAARFWPAPTPWPGWLHPRPPGA